MSIEIVSGDILEAPVNIICQQVNCRGAMEAGLAKQVKQKYPFVYEEYRNECMITPISDLLGFTQIVMIDKYHYIANLFAQLNYGEERCYTNYYSLIRCFEQLFDYASRYNFSVGIPYGIGCGLAGGNWKTVSTIIELTAAKYADLDIRLYKRVENGIR